MLLYTNWQCDLRTEYQLRKFVLYIGYNEISVYRNNFSSRLKSLRPKFHCFWFSPSFEIKRKIVSGAVGFRLSPPVAASPALHTHSSDDEPSSPIGNKEGFILLENQMFITQLLSFKHWSWT